MRRQHGVDYIVLAGYLKLLSPPLVRGLSHPYLLPIPTTPFPPHPPRCRQHGVDYVVLAGHLKLLDTATTTPHKGHPYPSPPHPHPSPSPAQAARGGLRGAGRVSEAAACLSSEGVSHSTPEHPLHPPPPSSLPFLALVSQTILAARSGLRGASRVCEVASRLSALHPQLIPFSCPQQFPTPPQRRQHRVDYVVLAGYLKLLPASLVEAVSTTAHKGPCSSHFPLIHTHPFPLLRQHRVDYIVLAGYLKLLPASLVEAFPQAILNIHPPRSAACVWGEGLLWHAHAQSILASLVKGYFGRCVHHADLAYGARCVHGAAMLWLLWCAAVVWVSGAQVTLRGGQHGLLWASACTVLSLPLAPALPSEPPGLPVQPGNHARAAEGGFGSTAGEAVRASIAEDGQSVESAREVEEEWVGHRSGWGAGVGGAQEWVGRRSRWGAGVGGAQEWVGRRSGWGGKWRGGHGVMVHWATTCRSSPSRTTLLFNAPCHPHHRQSHSFTIPSPVAAQSLALIHCCRCTAWCTVCPPDCQMLFEGVKDQLPPVGPGNFLARIIGCVLLCPVPCAMRVAPPSHPFCPYR
ncbi:unnamed protein product [Closterium sp. Yama58-4]|nr:unnamed protein product [Closterium sp. Yama58-4]